MWLWYFLVDLNAATIDKDPRRDLTRRYETLLKTFTSEKLELVQTDSICLMLALEQYKESDKSEKALNDYLYLAWVNYESYLPNGSIVWRRSKLWGCYDTVVWLINWKKITNDNYSYLIWLVNEINNPKNEWKFNTQQDLYNLFSQRIGHWYKVLFKVK